MIAAFGSGVSFSLVSGITQGNRYQGAFTTGVMFALFQGAFYKVALCMLLPFYLYSSTQNNSTSPERCVHSAALKEVLSAQG